MTNKTDADHAADAAVQGVNASTSLAANVARTTSYIDRNGVKHWGVMARAVQERETRKEDHTIKIVRIPLTDGSHVFSVYLGTYMLPAVSEAHATCLAVKLADAINQHTNELARVF